MILVVFHTAGINEKKNIIIMKKKKFLQNLGYCPSELKVGLGAGLGAGCWACRRWVGAGRARGVRGQRRGALGARRQARQACVGAGRGA